MANVKKKLRKALATIIWGVISVALIVAFIIGCTIANKWDAPLTGFFGSVGASGASSSVYEADDTSQSAIDATAEKVAEQIIREGTVLLKNDNNALPLAKGNKVSVFGVSSTFWMTSEKVDGVSNGAFTQALIDAGVDINTTLRSFYKSNTHKKFGTGGSMGDGSGAVNWKVDETPYSEYTDAVKNSYAQYHDAAFVVFSRGGSEGGDVPMWMDGQGGKYAQSYMSLSEEEDELLDNVTKNFNRVIVVIHSANAMDMSFLNKYKVDGVIWAPGTGDAPLTELGKLLVKDEDFSGRAVDTYVYDNMASTPAVQNFGDFRFVNSNGDLSGYSYVNYAESIYVGYKYYETRYEDVVKNVANVGTYDYAETVAFPFGYGLSYNTYAWSNMRVSAPDSDGNVTVNVDVKNNGTVPGKEVVQLYYSAPYTDYDKANGIEKSAVNLIGFDKTDTIPAGGTDTVTIKFNVKDMASWDSSYTHDITVDGSTQSVTGAYLLDDGTYYLTAAANAHEAVNNILVARDSVSSDKLVGIDGKAVNVRSELVDSSIVYADKQYITVSHTGNAYQNNFADMKLSDAKYLSRTNWAALENNGLVYQNGTKNGVSNVMAADGKVYTHTISDANKAKLSATGWASSGNPNDPSDSSLYGSIKYGSKSSVKLADLRGLDYNDEKWDELLNSLSLSEMSGLFAKGGYGTAKIDSIDKPETREYDGPARILNLFSGETTYVYPAECMMAATWNIELLEDVGSNIGDQCLLDGISGWYAPAMNTHRTAFGGRNFEYYSEDGVLSGLLAASETKGVQAKGVYVYIKHFALNEQETNRGSNGRYAVFGTEQAVREIYLKPFQIAVEQGDAHGAMASMNRVGYRYAITNYDLLTKTLRDEWGFKGIVVTDYISNLAAGEAEAGIAAGLDLQLITYSNPLSESSLAKPGVKYQLREATHHILYTQANSLAMNGYDFGTPIYVILLIVLGIVIGLYIALSGYFVIKYSYFKAKNAGWMKMSKVDTIIACVAAGILLACLIVVAVWFFKTALPALQFAFQI